MNNFIESDELTNAEKRDIKQEFKENIKKEERLNKIGDGIEENITKEEKVRTFFDKIEFLGLENDQKEEVVLKVKSDASGDKLYWIEIFLSSIIAALGLIQNSVAVVIGAMLIAPLLRPINGVAFSIARGEHNFFLIAFRVLILSIIASISMGIVVSFLVGLEIETTEIIARTSPNIIDFFIAIFSAMVAVMSLRFVRLGESIAGVAMAASLMPPLVVVGIELAMMNFVLAWGAMMLFATNLVAIIIIGTIFFWLYGFTPHIEKQQKHMYKGLTFVVILIIIIMIPLVGSFTKIRENIKISKDIKSYLNIIIGNKIDNYSISNIKVKNTRKDLIIIESTIKIQENIDLNDILNKIDSELSDKYGKTVKIDLEIIRVVSIMSEK